MRLIVFCNDKRTYRIATTLAPHAKGNGERKGMLQDGYVVTNLVTPNPIPAKYSKQTQQNKLSLGRILL